MPVEYLGVLEGSTEGVSKKPLFVPAATTEVTAATGLAAATGVAATTGPTAATASGTVVTVAASCEVSLRLSRSVLGERVSVLGGTVAEEAYTFSARGLDSDWLRGLTGDDKQVRSHVPLTVFTV